MRFPFQDFYCKGLSSTVQDENPGKIEFSQDFIKGDSTNTYINEFE